MNLRRAAQSAGLVGGLAWVATAFVWDGGSDPLELALFWVGATLLTVFLLELGTLLVKRGLLALRLFVACALPLLFWMVVLFATGSSSDDGPLYGVAGAVAGIFCVVQLARPAPQRATF